MKVMKFGGSSLATPRRVRGVATLVRAAAKRREEPVVVVSAFQGVTNDLLALAREAEGAPGDADSPAWKGIRDRHLAALRDISRSPSLSKEVEADFRVMRGALTGISLLRHAHPSSLDLLAGFGEILSARIVAAAVGPGGVMVDTRSLVVTDDRFTEARIDFPATNRKIRAFFRNLRHRNPRAIPIVTGFIGATPDGRATTIGRNGSDTTASVVAAALGAAVVEIWTDVDGILSADPRVVAGAFVVPQVSYEEAMELSYFGAKVVHPASIAPAVARGIPIVVRNTFHPEHPGTRVTSEAEPGGAVAKGITSLDGMSLLTLRGAGLVGVVGVAERLFGALARREVNVILISQASSEHTICFAVSAADAPAARGAIEREFRREMEDGLTSLEESAKQTIVAVVGDGMRGRAGVSGRVFDALGRHGISIAAIAQGASERNISFVVAGRDARRAVNVVHEAFFEKRRRLAVALIGVGNIGSALLDQLRTQREKLLARGFDIRVAAIADSRRLVVDPEGIPLSGWRALLAASRVTMSPEELIRRFEAVAIPDRAIVDCTASEELVRAYPAFLHADFHLVTPNKKANVLPPADYDRLVDLVRARRKEFLFEANVGAGLPVISTLHDLLASGDRVERIEGLLSGTLSALFNRLSLPGARRNDVPRFSELVRAAREEGLTEPDPREDLSGRDVARKLLILARQLGQRRALESIKVDNLVPTGLRRGPFRASFFDSLARGDEEWARRVRRARARGAVLRYVGSLDARGAKAGVVPVPVGHPFAAARGSDNVLVFTTARYAKTPLVIQGPGAGADVTAMGVFSDLLRLLHSLPS